MAKRTPAGKRDKRVRIYQQAANTTTNSDGQIPEDPELYATRWARVEPLRGEEKVAAQQVQATANYRVSLPSDPETRAITAKMWLLMEDNTRLNVKSVVDVDLANVEVELLCSG